MDIAFSSEKLRRVFNSDSQLRRKYGDRQAKRIQQRLFELYAAESLADVSHLPPPRCHALTGDRAGQFAVDVIHPYRLIFEPAHTPIPRLADGSVDRASVTAIRILEVEDYHGK
jgi:toxin HigB-1